jgi:YVTN family beta-propeller protein
MRLREGAAALLVALLAGCSSARGSAGGRAHVVRVYVTNEASGDLSIIDADTTALIETVPLGKRPRGINVAPGGRSLYVALSGPPIGGPGVEKESLPPADRSADGIGDVDADTGKLKRIIHAGIDPEQLDVSADGTRLYVANEDAAQVSVVDLRTGKVSEADGAVFAIDTASNTVLQRIEVGHRPRSVGFLPDGSRAYVTLENDGAVAVVDSQARRFLHRIQLDGHRAAPKPRPMGIAVRPDGSAVYVSAGSFGSLFFIDPAADAASDPLPVGQRPWGIALLPDGKTLYSANGPSNDVSVVDLPSRTVVKRIKVDDRPWGVAVLAR